MKLSIIIPVYYNEENLEPLYEDTLFWNFLVFVSMIVLPVIIRCIIEKFQRVLLKTYM